MGAFCVVVGAPGSQRDAGIVQRWEQGFVQQLIPQATVEAFDESILGRLSGCDVMPFGLAVIGKGQDHIRSELGCITPSE